MAEITKLTTSAKGKIKIVPSSPNLAVRLRGFYRIFGRNVILDNLDLDIRAGEFVALLGRSGSGKTTLLRALAGLDPASAYEFSIPEARAIVFQEPRLLLWKRVWRNVVLGLKTKNGRQRAVEALNDVGLGHRIDAWPGTLSGGEAQRVALARALVREPKLLLLDEPFASLDALTRIRMHGLVDELWRAHGPAVLLVTHDVDEAVLLADRVLVLADGKIAVEEKITLPRPRLGGHTDFQEIRTRLLLALGVDEGRRAEPAKRHAADAAAPGTTGDAS